MNLNRCHSTWIFPKDNQPHCNLHDVDLSLVDITHANTDIWQCAVEAALYTTLVIENEHNANVCERNLQTLKGLRAEIKALKLRNKELEEPEGGCMGDLEDDEDAQNNP